MTFNDSPSTTRPSSDSDLDLRPTSDVASDPSTVTPRYVVIELPSDGSWRVAPWSTVSLEPTGRAALNLTPDAVRNLPRYRLADPIRTQELDRRLIDDAPPRRSGMKALLAVVAILLIAGFVYVTSRPSAPASGEVRRVASAVTNAAAVATERSTDATITMKVKTALALSKRVNAFEVSVDTDHRVTTLTGTVGSQQTRDIAEQIAADTSGVQSVNNRLMVSGD